MVDCALVTVVARLFCSSQWIEHLYITHVGARHHEIVIGHESAACECVSLTVIQLLETEGLDGTEATVQEFTVQFATFEASGRWR